MVFTFAGFISLLDLCDLSTRLSADFHQIQAEYGCFMATVSDGTEMPSRWGDCLQFRRCAEVVRLLDNLERVAGQGACGTLKTRAASNFDTYVVNTAPKAVEHVFI